MGAPPDGQTGLQLPKRCGLKLCLSMRCLVCQTKSSSRLQVVVEVPKNARPGITKPISYKDFSVDSLLLLAVCFRIFVLM